MSGTTNGTSHNYFYSERSILEEIRKSVHDELQILFNVVMEENLQNTIESSTSSSLSVRIINKIHDVLEEYIIKTQLIRK